MSFLSRARKSIKRRVRKTFRSAGSRVKKAVKTVAPFNTQIPGLAAAKQASAIVAPIAGIVPLPGAKVIIPALASRAKFQPFARVPTLGSISQTGGSPMSLLSLITGAGRFLAPIAKQALTTTAQRRISTGTAIAAGGLAGAGLASLPSLPSFPGGSAVAVGAAPKKRRRSRGFSARDISQAKRIINMSHDICKKTKKRR